MGGNYEETKWRQGSHLNEGDVAQLFPTVAAAGNISAIVISHDCDISRPPDVEPVVEVLFGKLIENLEGNYTHAKNVRTLHIAATGGTTNVFVELQATARSSFPKKLILSIEPAGEIAFNSAELNTLQFWLAARYRRAAFPNSFNERLAKQRIAEKLAKKIGPRGGALVALYIEVDDQELTVEDDCYDLGIYALYADDGTEETYDSIKKLVKEIEQIFCKSFFDQQTQRWRGIQLTECTEVSTDAMSVALVARLRRWNADYLSLRSDPQQPVPE